MLPKFSNLNSKLEKNLRRPKGGYRSILVDQNQLANESLVLEPLMVILESDTLIDQDKVSYYILIYLNQRYPKNFLENWNPIVETSQKVESSKTLEDLNLRFTNPNVIARMQEKNVVTLFDVVNNFNFHSVPYSARFSLVNWYMGGKFNLVLYTNKIPSSKQVLKLQAMSKRCISLISNT